MRYSAQVRPTRHPKANSQETLALLKILAIENLDMEFGRASSARDVIARLKSGTCTR